MEYQSQELDKLFTALAKAQGQFTIVVPDEKVDFSTKSGQRVKYDYASFKALFLMAQKPLADNGLAVASFLQGNKLVTRLSHESGQWLTSECNISQDGDIKAFGADISYLRRYQYAAIIGAVIGGEDNEHVVGSREQAKRQSPPEQKPTNGSNATEALPTTLHNVPNNPKDIVAELNKVLGEEYYNVYRLLNALKLQNWPKPNDTSAWADVYTQGLDHARQRIAESNRF